jgi:hypothetical protein
MAVRRPLQIAGTKPIFRKGGFSRSGLQVSRFLQVLKAARARWKARSVTVMTRCGARKVGWASAKAPDSAVGLSGTCP